MNSHEEWSPLDASAAQPIRIHGLARKRKASQLSLESGRRTPRFVAFTLLACAAAYGCEQELPTGVGLQPLPGEPITVELEIPWSEFASNLEVFGGYGSPEDLNRGYVANQFADTLDARTLMRFTAYPGAVTARDSTGAQRPDSVITFVGGRLVAVFDTVASTNTGPVVVAVGRLQQEWDPTTTTWEAAIDTINDLRPWSEVGAGPVIGVDTVTWDPAAGDSVVFSLDSATVAAWADTDDLSRGARLEMIDTGSRLQLNGATLRLDIRPSIDPDTIIELSVGTSALTFIYSPFPEPPPDGVRIGGAPSWRTVLDVAIPEVFNGPPEFCAQVGCPFTPEPGQISFAALRLTSRTTEAAFQPTDTVRLDVRPVFARASMPKSPLGTSLIAAPLGRSVRPDAFGASAGDLIEVPFTAFARDLLRGEDLAGNPAPSSLALLSVFEPISISFASFEGPGSANEPTLRLVLTIGPPVELP
ncbi:MAG: hypothetical protein OEN56_10840, partial [Gemmatimonadota bacterium]|nr:hypothetical protein [Gemmatimonadota bacterium]